MVRPSIREGGIKIADMVQVHPDGVNGADGIGGRPGRLSGKNAIITGAAG